MYSTFTMCYVLKLKNSLGRYAGTCTCTLTLYVSETFYYKFYTYFFDNIL